MSRDNQIEKMAKDLAKHSFFYNGGCLMNYSNTAKLLYEAGYRKQSEWISVEERLPDKEGTYLTYTDKEKTIIDVFCIYPSHGTKFWVGGNGKVTHWMPLPEAPKMKGGVQE